jgi:hypothetical protein
MSNRPNDRQPDSAPWLLALPEGEPEFGQAAGARIEDHEPPSDRVGNSLDTFRVIPGQAPSEKLSLMVATPPRRD